MPAVADIDRFTERVSSMRAASLALRRAVRARVLRGVALRGIAMLAFLATTAPGALAQGYYNTELLGQFGYTRDSYAAVWGYSAPDSTEIAIIGTSTGTSFVDVTDPRHPEEIEFVIGAPSQWREMQTHSHYAYIVNESGGGMQIVDLADPLHPIHVADYDSTFQTAHTIHIRDGYAYVNGTNGGMRILDLADPIHPREVGVWNTRYVHDCYVRDSIVYACNISNAGFTALNVADKSNPIELSFTPYPGAATHNAWTTEDGRYLLTTDENEGGHLWIWDVSDPRHPSYVSEWRTNIGIIHNVTVRGDSAYIAYYTEGLQVLDISDPRMPLLVGSYDTFPGASGGYRGNWGVYPFAASGNIYLSDITSGLFVVRMASGGQPALDFFVNAPEGQVAQPGQQQALFFFDVFNGAGTARTFDLLATSSNGWQVSVPATLNVARNGTEPILVTVQIPASLTGPERLDVQLCVRSRSTMLASCKQTRLAVPVVLQDFAAEATAGGIALRWRLNLDGEAGSLVLSRAGGDAAFSEHARLTIDVRGYEDAGVEPGVRYRYRLGLETAAGMQVLGETSVQAAAAHARLLGTAPNPFAATTSVRFELARAGSVRLAVYDVRGRLVRALEREGLQAGAHALSWDGRDAHGTRLPSGVYLYEIASSGFRARGRVTLAE